MNKRKNIQNHRAGRNLDLRWKIRDHLHLPRLGYHKAPNYHKLQGRSTLSTHLPNLLQQIHKDSRTLERDLLLLSRKNSPASGRDLLQRSRRSNLNLDQELPLLTQSNPGLVLLKVQHRHIQPPQTRSPTIIDLVLYALPDLILQVMAAIP